MTALPRALVSLPSWRWLAGMRGLSDELAVAGYDNLRASQRAGPRLTGGGVELEGQLRETRSALPRIDTALMRGVHTECMVARGIVRQVDADLAAALKGPE